MTEGASKPTGAGSGRRIALVLIATLAVYFPAARWSRLAYLPLPEPNGAVVHLQSFHKSGPPGTFGYFSVAQAVQRESDTPEAPERSPYLLYEDNKPLGPAHSRKEDIERIGSGRFLHLGSIFFFSTSDNSDPGVNGRNYWIVLPPK